MDNGDFLIDADGLNAIIGQPDLCIVDCRFDLMQPDQGCADYLAGHIPGAVFADLDRDLAGPVGERTGRHPLPEVDELARKLGLWGIDARSHVVVYDAGNGALAARLWWLLRWLGHSSVSLLNGGYGAWADAGFTVEVDCVERIPRSFEASPESAWVISTEQLLTHMDSNSLPLLVDARDADRFAGRKEPIDSIAGHVPGAVNFPLTRSLDQNGRWLTADQLRSRWKEVVPDGSDEPWVVMCGSGVTACHLSLSAQYAGLRAPQVYIGSWSEWIRDLRRPVVSDAG